MTCFYSDGILVDHILDGAYQEAAQEDAQAQSDDNDEGNGLLSQLLSLESFLPLALASVNFALLLPDFLLIGCTHEIISSQFVLMGIHAKGFNA